MRRGVGLRRGRRAVRTLGEADRGRALEVCARRPAVGVYVAARLAEGDLDRTRGSLLGYAPEDGIEAICWVSANIVPVGCDEAAAVAFAGQLRRHRSRVSSIFGQAMEVAWLWDALAPFWGEPLDLRVPQPLMQLAPDAPLGVAPDPLVVPATAADLDLLVPASAAMFTEEIGYPPYRDAAGANHYRRAVGTLVGRGHSFVRIDDDRVVFKADIGSVGVGACQIQGVWIDPEFRGRGLAAPAMAAVVAQARRVAPLVSLYVNGYNAPALATYRRVGFEEIDRFATLLF